MAQPIVSTRARNLLKRLMASEDRELVYEPGAGWWLDADQIAGRDAMELRRFCLIREINFQGARMTVYVPDESEAQRLAEDPAYVPEIVQLVAQQRNTHGTEGESMGSDTLKSSAAERKRATIVAALENWKRQLGSGGVPLLDWQSATNHEAFNPLDEDAVARLITELKTLPPLVIDLEGGLVQGVRGRLLGQPVNTRDYDSEGADPEDIQIDEEGREHVPGYAIDLD